jgi:hypothetical protein
MKSAGAITLMAAGVSFGCSVTPSGDAGEGEDVTFEHLAAAGNGVCNDVDGDCGTYKPGKPGAGTGITPAVDFMNFGPGLLTLRPGDTRAIGGAKLKLTTTGEIQVVNAAKQVVWRSNTSATCDASSCALVFQGDGNAVLYGPSEPLWSTGTYNAGAVFTFSSRAPYLSVRDRKFNVIWSSGGSGGSLNVAASRRQGPQASSVRSFLDSMGINSHMDQSGMSAETMLSMLQYLNVRFIRDGWRADGSLLDRYKELSAHNINFNIGLGDPYSAASFDGPRALAALRPGRLVSLEGPNEINNFPFACDGTVSQTGWPNENGPLVQCFMTKAYAGVHRDPKLLGVPLIDLTWAGTSDAEKYGMLDLAGQADYGNMHYYNTLQPYWEMLSSFAGTYHSVFPVRAQITETGYNTDEVSPAAQAVMVLNTYLDAFQHGFARTYMYELNDEWQNYGLFDKTLAPKPAAVAVHNLTTILADGTGRASADSLPYSISGMPADGHSLLLQKSDGDFYLVLWNEAEVHQDGSDTSVVPSPVVVDFGATFSEVSVFSPIDGEASAQSATWAASMNLSLGSKALIVRLHR